MRVAANWLIQALLGTEVSRLGFLNRSIETLVDMEEYSRYLTPEQAKEQVAVGG